MQAESLAWPPTGFGSSTASSARGSRRRTWAALGVLAAHALIVWLGWQVKLVVSVAHEAAGVTTLRLLPPERRETARPAAQPPATETAPTRQATTAPRAAKPAPAEPVPIVAMPLPTTSQPVANAPPSGQGRVALDGSEAAPPGPPARAASGTGGLVLTPGREVLSESFANPAVLDPRSNTPVPTFEERIALGLNPKLCLKVERLPDGSTRRALVERIVVTTIGSKTGIVKMCP